MCGMGKVWPLLMYIAHKYNMLFRAIRQSGAFCGQETQEDGIRNNSYMLFRVQYRGESFEDWAAIPVWSLSLTVLYTTKGNEQR